VTVAPRVFISHSSDDKDRFARALATKLREKGIDAWLDEWEILPGDSLVQKLFAEGLQPATAVIVVLSNASIHSQWVREEIDFAFVKRVNEGSRLIPVLIDDVEVPPQLQATLWYRVKDVSNIDADVQRLVDAVFGHKAAPPIGVVPAYLAAGGCPAGMQASDWFVVEMSAKKRMKDRVGLVNHQDLLEAASAAGLSHDDALDAVEVLDSRGIVKNRWALGRRCVAYSVTTLGFGEWLRGAMPDLDTVFRSVSLALVNQTQRWAHEVAATLGQPEAIVEYVFAALEQEGLVTLRKSFGLRSAFVVGVTADLRRRVR